mmetsp:Transcript_69222/g.190036  ORF Transcript_69222/g.190036 Transcript_69222/m.190036 type:complete len:128 (-) Transcript_69222:413-796(-)
MGATELAHTRLKQTKSITIPGAASDVWSTLHQLLNVDTMDLTKGSTLVLSSNGTVECDVVSAYPCLTVASKSFSDTVNLSKLQITAVVTDVDTNAVLSVEVVLAGHQDSLEAVFADIDARVLGVLQH